MLQLEGFAKKEKKNLVYPMVVLSTTEAESMTTIQACKEKNCIRRLLKKLRHKQEAILLYYDS